MTGTRDGSDRADGEARGHEETVLSAADIIPVREARPPRRKKDDDIPPGTLLGGHYRVVRRLGGGAIGHVYEAINTWTTRRVALKLLRAELVDDPDIAKRFLIEAQAATRVAHPHIVDILDMGKDPASSHLYIVQEFLEGRDLHEHLKQRGRLTVLEAQQVLIPVMQAVAAAHEKGVLHRDLKPENVFLVQSPDGHTVPKVIDFGLARTEATAGNRMTRTGAVMGTPYYMSPEQARGESTLDARADVWSLGVMWYEIIAGELPFAGDNLHAVLHAIFMSNPRRLDERVPEVPREIADAIHRAFSRDLTVRYATVNDFLDALLMVLPDEPIPTSALRSSRPGRPSSASMQPTAVASPSLLPSGSPSIAIPSLASPPPLDSGTPTLPPAPPQEPWPDLIAQYERRIRSLYVVLGLALTALLFVSVVAIQLMKRESQRASLTPVIDTASTRAAHALIRAHAAILAAPDAAAALTTVDASLAADLDASDVDAAAPPADPDAAVTAIDDATASPLDEPPTVGRHHRRSRHGRDADAGAASPASTRHHRHRH